MKARILGGKELPTCHSRNVSRGWKNTFQTCCGRDLGTDFLGGWAVKCAFSPKYLCFMSNLLERGRH